MSETDFLQEVVQDPIPADKNLRFLNLLVDTIAFYALAFLLGMVLGVLAPEIFLREELGSKLMLNLVTILLFVSYFGILEGLTKGKTLGKLLTGTRAVKLDGSPITFGDAFKRALSRVVPFEAFSGFADRPWHDSWTDTVVIKEIKN